MLKFEERKRKFENDLGKIVAKYNIDLYAANVMLPNGEVMPMIKLADLLEEDADKTSK